MEIVIMVHVFPSSLVADDRRTTTAHEQPNAQSATRLSSRTEGNEAVYFMRGSNAAQNAAKLSWLIRTAELGNVSRQLRRLASGRGRTCSARWSRALARRASM